MPVHLPLFVWMSYLPTIINIIICTGCMYVCMYCVYGQWHNNMLQAYSDILWLYCVLYASHTDTRQNLAVRVFALPILVGGGIQECLFVVVFCLIQVVSTHLLPLSFALSLSPFSAISPLYSCSPLLPSLVLIPTRSLPPSLPPSLPWPLPLPPVVLLRPCKRTSHGER